jgi:hypothetical protein
MTHKSIEIIIQTDQIFTVRSSACSRLWCRHCGCEVDVVEAQTLSGKGQRMLDTGTETRQWHCFEAPDGMPLVCVESLLSSHC